MIPKKNTKQLRLNILSWLAVVLGLLWVTSQPWAKPHVADAVLDIEAGGRTWAGMFIALGDIAAEVFANWQQMLVAVGAVVISVLSIRNLLKGKK